MIIPGARRPVGFKSETLQRPFLLEDPMRMVNEIAVIKTSPRKVVLILSFSNPQARIVADGYHFEWFESGQLKSTCAVKLTQPLVNPNRKFNAFWVLADTDSVIEEAALMTNAAPGVQIAGFSFRDRYLGLLPPEYHVEWTEGVSLSAANGGGNPNLILGPEALG